MSKILTKPYQCSRCGHVKMIETNHFGRCWSFGRFNTCPACPPWAKYSEFGGQTVWRCLALPIVELPVFPLSDLPTTADCRRLKINLKSRPKQIFARPTGEYREPLRGEWYLSGATVEAYRCNGHYHAKRHIAKLVVLADN